MDERGVARERRASKERRVSMDLRASSDWRGYVSWTLSVIGERAEMSWLVLERELLLLLVIDVQMISGTNQNFRAKC